MATASASATTSLHSIGGMPHGLGLLTTVASLPPKYRSRYLNIKTRCEIPLDLSVKPMSPQIANDVPLASNFTEVYTEPSVEQASAGATTPTDAADALIASIATAVAQEHEQQQREREAAEKQMTPPPPPPAVAMATTPTPLKRKWVERERAEREREEAAAKKVKLEQSAAEASRCSTPAKPIRVSEAASRTAKSQSHHGKAAAGGGASKNKATRKLKFDEETSSPVSGTIIRPLEDVTDGSMQYSNGDIDPRYNIVEITEETKAELAAIKNVIGDYICKLCRIRFDDAFGLAQHRCACIVLLEYRCPECGKQFNCPANLASHRRWHKPKKGDAAGGGGESGNGGAAARKENRQNNGNVTTTNGRKAEEPEHTCEQCGKQFKRLAYLRKHQSTHNNNNNNNNNNGGNAKKAKSTATTTPVPLPLSTAALTGPTALDCPSYASSSSAASSVRSFVTHASQPQDEADYERSATTTTTNHYGDIADSLSDCSSRSSSSAGYGRLQIVESGLTEEENIAAAALTNLRNCASVIQHTTMAH